MPTLYELADEPIHYAGMGDVILLSDGRILNWRTLPSQGRSLIRGDYFDANGVSTGQFFQTIEPAFAHDLVALNNGGVAIVYHNDQAPSAQSHEVYLAIYNSVGVKIVEGVKVNVTSTSLQYFPKVAVLESGRIVITWQDDSGMNGDGDRGVMARIFNENGTPAGGEFLVNTTVAGLQQDPAVLGLPDGGFLIAWNTGRQLFDANGVKVGPERLGGFSDLHLLANGNIVGIGVESLSVLDPTGATVLATAQFSDPVVFLGAFAGGFVVRSAGLTAIFDNLAVQQGSAFSTMWSLVAPGDDGGFTFYSNDEIGHVRVDDGVGETIVTPVPGGLSETTPQNNLVATIAIAGEALNTTYTLEILSDSLGGAFEVIGNRLFLVDNGSLDFETAPTVTVTYSATDLNGNQYIDTFTLNVADEAIEQRITASPALPVIGSATAPLAFDRVLSVTPDSSGVGGQILDADLNLIKSFQVADLASGFMTDLKVLALPAGGFVLTWRAGNGDGLGDGIVVRIFDSEGNPLTGVTTVNTPTVQVTRNPDIVALASGEFLIAWEEVGGDGGGANEIGIRAQRFSAAGAEIGPEFTLTTTVFANQQLVSLHPLVSGGFLATWSDSSGQGGDSAGSSIKGQLFDSAAQRVGGEFLVNTTTVGSQGGSNAITLASGQILVFWTDSGASGSSNADNSIRGQLFDSAGAKIGGEIVLQLAAGAARAVALASGGFALAWTDVGTAPEITNDPGDTGTWARLFNADGSPAGSKFLVNTDVVGDQNLFDLEVLPSGELYIAWSSPVPGGAPQARIFDLTGTRTDWSVDDRLAGTAGADVLRGGTGNDIYVVNHPGDVAIELPGEGTDIIYSSISYSLSDAYEVESLATLDWDSTDPLNLTGNSLNNTLIGNAGANQLNGAGGADIMFGREGNDIYIVDNAADQPTEYAGEGIDTVYSSISYTLAAGTDVEGLATLDWGSTAPLSLTGNEIANTLIGNAGANQLDGRAGADVMVGREGNDIYLVDNAGDKAFENAGEGYDVIYSAVSFALTNDQSLEGLSTINWNATDAIDLTGNSADNYLIGNAGSNVLNGGAGNDVLHGKEGADTYQFTALLGPTNVDLILEYSSADDTIALDNNGIFTGLADGVLPAGAFVIGTAAQDADDRIVYNQATGQLFFDADGNGIGAQVQFALLSGAPAITAADFIVI